jgi:hypothetical protein
MRSRLDLLGLLAIITLGALFYAKSGGVSAPIPAMSFGDRWAPVEEALHSGQFAVKHDAGRR